MSDSKNKTNRLINNTKIFAIGNIITKACQYILITLCTYKLTKAEYGVADTIIQTATMFIPIFSLDISEAVFRFSMDTDNDDSQKIYTNALFIGGMGFVLSIFLMPLYNLFPFFQKRIRYVLVLTVFEFVQMCTKEYVRGVGKTKVYMFGGVINAISQIIGCIVFVYVLDLHLVGYISALSVAYVVEFMFYLCKLKLYKQISINYVKIEIYKKLLKFSVPLIPNTIMWWIIGASDRYFVLWMISEEATGLYAVAAKFPALITVVTSIFFKAWEISAVEQKQEVEREVFYNKIFNLLLGTMTILLSLAIIAIKPLIYVMVAPQFREGWVFAPFLLLAATFSSFQTFLGTNYTVEKDSIGTLKSTTFAAIINLALNYLLIGKIGIQGATIATAISYFAVALYRYIDTRKYIRTKISNLKNVIVSYMLLVVEICIISFYPSTYWISIIICIMVIILNREIIDKLHSYINTKVCKK